MTAAWPRTDQRLERSYRRLLLAYPGRYRRRHGAEIITTLLEIAEPGQRRPERGEAWHLFASGLRQRFRLPAGRPLVWVAAVLITLIVGAFGAAAGSFAGVQTFASLPDAAVLAERATGSGGGTVVADHQSPWFDGGLYTATEVDGTWQIEASRQRLRADGWAVGPVTPLSGSTAAFDPATGTTIDIPMHNGGFHADKDGVEVSVEGFLTDRDGRVHVEAWPRATPAFLPLVVAGTALGLVAGWLLAAAGAYRIGRARRSWAAATTCALAVLTLALPAVALYGNVMRAFRYADNVSPVMTVHNAFVPGLYYPFGPEWLILALTVAGVALAAATTLLARPGAPAVPQESPAAS